MVEKLIEYIPLIAFFFSYQFGGAVFATKILVISTVLTSLVTYLVYGKISKLNIFSAITVILFGSLTIYTNNPVFIKIKPTILYLIIASILFFGLLRDSFYIKYLFGKVMTLSDDKWRKMSKKVILFFITMAIFNEVVWRNFSEETWIKFKVIGLPILLITYTAYLVYQLKAYIHHDKI